MYFSLQMLDNFENKRHRGQVLASVAKASGMTVESIVKRLKYNSRNSFYNHTRNPDLSLAILARYGKLFNYDFSVDIEEMKAFSVKEDEGHYTNNPKSRADAINQRDYYKDLYMELLEKVRELKQEISELKAQKVNGQ
ncbi:hypothetical protein EGI32_01250 [Ferruginibacter sp. HRS2-29]|nr:hypothetical protein [Ferruginibacter sp. HRS2-29]